MVFLKMKILTIFFVLFLITAISADYNVSCRDEDNNFVDWFYLYKLPKEFHNETENDNSADYDKRSKGLRYIYITSKTYQQQGWQLSDLLINDAESFPGQTISAVSNRSDVLFMAYNDETPDDLEKNRLGHTKGVVAADQEAGFWLIHSVPKYPNLTSNDYIYPWTGLHYGQSFLCISFNSSQVDKVGNQLIFNEPLVFSSNFPDNLKQKYPNMVQVLNKKWKMEAPFWNDLEIISINGTHFRSFAKGRKFKKELYEDYVAPALNEDLLVETWRHGTGNFPSNCTRQRRIYNVSALKMENIQLSFNSTSDHSKWAVSKDEKKWICVGDINRAQGQLNRGGGTVCQLNAKIAELYHNLVGSFESC